MFGFVDLKVKLIEDAEACLLFRLASGTVAKRFIENLPDWELPILPK